MLEIGSLIDGKYKIIEKVGQGGMSVVYMALNPRANKTWAIKEVRKDGVQNFEVVKQGLIAETEILKKLNHPNIVSISDVIEDEECFLIVMDYIEGNTLQKVLEEKGPQSQENVVNWAKQICNALGYLHSRRQPIIYRDMKPGNVMLRPDGSVILVDFGTAREYKVGSSSDTTVLGTKGYAAPEQYGGQGQTDARTDIYCLGATMHQLLTGQDPCKPPYTRYPIREYNPSLSYGLEAVIAKCTNDNPEERYQSCAELLYDLENYKSREPQYKRKQNRRLGSFIISAVFSVIFMISAISCRVLANSTQQSSYNAYLEDAKFMPAKDEKTEKYQLAISLDPTRSEAYMALLNLFMEDDNFASAEDEVMRQVLIGKNSSKTNESAFKANVVGYDEFSYELGLAYFYSYEERGNKSQATKWLDNAAASVTLDKAKVERARRLGRIASYYSKIGKESKSGDASTSYQDYWNDMVELSGGNIVAIDNSITALMMYKELVYQIYSYTDRFKAAGVTKQEMLEQLDNIEIRLVSDIIIQDDNNKTRITNMKNELNQNIALARRTVEDTYAAQAGGVKE